MTEDSIEQIAERNGFANRHYFTRVFTRTMKTGPGKFRSGTRAQSGVRTGKVGRAVFGR